MIDDVCRCFFDDDVAYEDKRAVRFCAYCGLTLIPGKKCPCLSLDDKTSVDKPDGVKTKMKISEKKESEKKATLKVGVTKRNPEIKSTMKKTGQVDEMLANTVICKSSSYLKKPDKI